MPHVIAIAAPPGGGKSTLARALAARLPGAAVVDFDRYQQITDRPVAEIARQTRDGADLDTLEIPLLAEHLARLKSGDPVSDPATGAAVAPGSCVLFETPLGREHRASGRFIDLLVWIEIPLDIALARNLRAFTRSFLEREPRERHSDRLAWLSRYTEHYLADVRPMLATQRERVRAGADLVVDGCAPCEANADTALGEIRQRFGQEIP